MSPSSLIPGSTDSRYFHFMGKFTICKLPFDLENGVMVSKTQSALGIVLGLSQWYIHAMGENQLT